MNRSQQERLEGGTRSTAKDSSRPTAIPGGMGSCLFPPIHPSLGVKPSSESERDVAVSLQLLVALFLLSVERRSIALESLSRSVALETKATQDDCDEDAAAPPAGEEEGDDPAIAMALTYFDDETSESKDSLEAKGMTRKAAAAAHDAAVLLESLQKRSKAWREEVKLFSHCVMFAMRYLRRFFQGIVRRWLQERQCLSASNCQNLLSRTVISKLVDAVTSLTSLTPDSFSHLVVEDDDEHLKTQIESIFMPTKLYQDSLML